MLERDGAEAISLFVADLQRNTRDVMDQATMTGMYGPHRRGNAQRFVNAGEVVIEKVNSYGIGMILKLSLRSRWLAG